MSDMSIEALHALKHGMLFLEKLRAVPVDQLELLMVHFNQEGTHIRANGADFFAAQLHLMAIVTHLQYINEEV